MAAACLPRLIRRMEPITRPQIKEYVSGGGMSAVIDPSDGTYYTTADHLGSARVVTNIRRYRIYD